MSGKLLSTRSGGRIRPQRYPTIEFEDRSQGRSPDEGVRRYVNKISVP